MYTRPLLGPSRYPVRVILGPSKNSLVSSHSITPLPGICCLPSLVSRTWDTGVLNPSLSLVWLASES